MSKVQSPKSKVRSQESGVSSHRARTRRTRDFGLWTLDFGRGRSRAGVTLLEVLFAIMIASVGLLGAIAVFPVALATARKGVQADATAVGANAAVAKFDAELMRRPDRWLYWNSNGMPPQTAFLPLDFNETGSSFFGYALCIDPMGFAHNREEDAANGTNNGGLWSWFPAVPYNAMGPNAVPATQSRMYRLTLHNNNPSFLTDASYQMSYLHADKVFRIEDELMFERPADNTLPAAQLFTKMIDGSGNPTPGRRQEEGRLTWFATLVPKLDRHNTQLGEEYVLSIVVCLNRSGEATHVPGSGDPAEKHPWPEWTARILGPNGINANGDFHSSGVGGGEVTLSTFDRNITAEQNLDAHFYSPEALEVRHGSWVMLGRLLSGNGSSARQHFQWYRISDAEEEVRHEDTDNNNNPDRYQRDVTLIGPDWPADVANPVGVSEPCDVIIMPHVVYVYERTIKIDTGAQ